jgi:hypothetical protein
MARALVVLAGPGWRCSGDELLWFAQRFRDNLKRCSCSGCGNPRRHYGQARVRRGMGFRDEVLTPQERRADLDWDQVDEFFAGRVDSGDDLD